MLLHQGLGSIAKSWRSAVGAERQAGLRQAGSLARNGARLGTRAEGPGNAVGHGCEYGRSRGGMEALKLAASAAAGLARARFDLCAAT